jgi:hypothetical protein
MSKKTQKTMLFGKMLLCSLLMLIALPAATMANDNYAEEVVCANEDEATVVFGYVIDKQTREPLLGASVAIWKDGELLTGTSTNLEGDFRIISPVNDFEVEVTFVGYRPIRFRSNERKLKDMIIELEEDANTLGDVVITSFVTKNKQTFTGSATEISGVELKQVSSTNILNAIAALTPGMSMVQNNSQGSNPNHMPELVLRGMSSFSNEGQ